MKRKETILFAVIIALANIPLLFGRFPELLIYLPQKVLAGQWWRLMTHPFVHVSVYHLLLDGAAFLLLYAQLQEGRLARRMLYLLGIHAGVTAAVTMTLPHVSAVGYCGLSGLAHGLMALWCIERVASSQTDKTERTIAAVVGLALLVKSIYETAAGQVFFESMHLGSVGVPIVTSHLAGVVSAVVMVGLVNMKKIKTQWLLPKRALKS